MLEEKIYLCEGKVMSLAEGFQNISDSNLIELCNCFIGKIDKNNSNFQSLGNCSFDFYDNPEKKLLSEIFYFQHNMIPQFKGRIWIERILGLFLLLLIEIVGNSCLFATIAYER